MNLAKLSFRFAPAMIWKYLPMGVFCIALQTLFAQLPPASFNQLKRDERLLSSFYHCLAEDEYGFIWFGSRHGGGLYRFDGYDLKTFVVDPSRLHTSLSSNMINTVFSYGDGNLYVGTHGGITILNLVTGTMRCYADEGSKVPDYIALYTEPIIPDPKHECIWIGNAYGLCKLMNGSDTLLGLRPGKLADGMPEPKGVIDLLVDREDENMLWLGTISGLYSYNIDANAYQYHPYEGTETKVVMDLHQDEKGDIWIAGDARSSPQRGQVLRYHPDDHSWNEYKLSVDSSGHTLLPGEAYCIMPAMSKEVFWVSTRKSVGVLNTTTGAYEAWIYDPQKPDGLLPNEFFRAMLKDRHGRLWISSWQGIQYAKNAFAGNGKPAFTPRIAITEVKISNARADMIEPLLYQEMVQLRKDQRDVSIRYVFPNPLDTRNVTYTYQLEGRDKEWTTTDQRHVQYTGLHGGEYTFLVRGKEGNGEWGEITRLAISIEKTLTEYVTFWILLFLLGGSMIIGTTRYFISRTRKEEQLKAEFNKKVSEIEMQALRAQMNPHFLFNSLNSIKYYALSKDKDATAEYLTKFALLVRTILNNSKSHTISLKDELEALRLYIEIEHLRLEGKFAYQIDIDSGIRIEQAQIPPMILQPFVENAIWHGLMHKTAGGKLLVQVKDLGTQIQCIIEDNGVGRAKAREIQQNGSGHKKSVGIQITGDRIALINRIYGIDTQVHIIDLMNSKGEAEGTRVIVNIPLINEDEV